MLFISPLSGDLLLRKIDDLLLRKIEDCKLLLTPLNMKLKNLTKWYAFINRTQVNMKGNNKTLENASPGDLIFFWLENRR